MSSENSPEQQSQQNENRREEINQVGAEVGTEQQDEGTSGEDQEKSGGEGKTLPQSPPTHQQQDKPTDAKTTDLVEEENLYSVVKKLLVIAAPIGGSTFLNNAPRLIATFFLAQRTNASVLAAFGVAATTFNIAALSVGIGLTTALDTFVSQAYGRDPTSPELGVLLQRGLFVCLLAALPFGLLLTFFSRPLVAAVFSESLSVGAAPYLENCLPFLLAVIVSFCLSSLCNSVRQTKVPLYANIASTASALLLCYLFVYDLSSLIYCNLVNYLISDVVVLLYIFRIGDSEAFAGVRAAKWSPSEICWQEVTGWVNFKKYLAIGLPASVAVCSEWWAYEVLTIIAAWCGEEDVAVLTVMLSVFILFFINCSALSRASGVTVGNSLGAGRPNLAYLFYKASVALVMMGCAVNAAVIYFGCEKLFGIYTNDVTILKHAPKLAPWMAASNFFDSIQFTLQGVFRGAGRQSESVGRVLASLWLVGVTSSFYLGYRFGYGIEGIAAGIVIGVIVEVPLLFECIQKWNWEELSRAARKSQVTDA